MSDNTNIPQTEPDDASTDAVTNSELDEVKAERDRNLAGWQRAQADMENFRRKSEERQRDSLEFGKEVVIARLLPTLDSIDQALANLPDESASDFLTQYQTFKTSLQTFRKQLGQTLQDMGVEQIFATGQTFDPNLHEAIRQVPGETDGQVVEQVQTGYRVNGKLVRPAQVIISSTQVN